MYPLLYNILDIIKKGNHPMTSDKKQLIPHETSQNVYYMFHKPAGCITAKTDEQHATVMKYFKDIKNPDLHPVGRLDKDTEGLLLFTDDGKFNQFLMHPENHIEKTYEFCVLGDLTTAYIKELEGGIYLTGSDKITSPCSISVKRKSTLQEIVPLIQGTHYRNLLKNQMSHPVTFGSITITEGRKHHIKRLMKHAHCCVVALKRVSIGNLILDETLSPGEYRPLTKEELSSLGW